MSTITRYPTTHAAVSGVGFATNTANAYSATDSNAVASTGTIGKNSTLSGDFGGFDTSAVPAGSTINNVAVQVRWRHTGNSTGSSLGAYLVGAGGTIGSELTRALVTVLTADAATITGVAYADLAALAVRVRGTRAGSNTTTAAELEYVRVVVDYTAPAPQNYVETGTAAGEGSVTATDVYTPGSQNYVETGTASGEGSVTAASVAQFVGTATASGEGVTTGADTFQAVETATASGFGSVAGTDVYSGTNQDYVETGTASGAGSVTASDVLGCIEIATAFGEAATTGADAAAFVEVATASGAGSVTATDVGPGGEETGPPFPPQRSRLGFTRPMWWRLRWRVR